MSNKEQGIAYDDYIIQELQRIGYRVFGTPASGDQGADIVIEILPNVRVIVQCKYYSKAVGNKPIQEIVGAKQFYHACYCIACTNQKFTPAAITLANANGVSLVSNFDIGDSISIFIEKAGLLPLNLFTTYTSEIRELKEKLKVLGMENMQLQQKVNMLESSAKRRDDVVAKASEARSYKPLRYKYGKQGLY